MTGHNPKGHAAPVDPVADPLAGADAFTDVPQADGKVPAAGEVDADDMFVQGGE